MGIVTDRAPITPRSVPSSMIPAVSVRMAVQSGDTCIVAGET